MRILRFLGSKKKEAPILKKFLGEEKGAKKQIYCRIPYFAPLFVKKGSREALEFLDMIWIEKIPNVFLKSIILPLLKISQVLNTPYLLKSFSVKVYSNDAPDIILINQFKSKKFYFDKRQISNLGYGFRGEKGIVQEVKNRKLFSEYVNVPKIIEVNEEENYFIEELLAGKTLSVNNIEESIKEALSIMQLLLPLYERFAQKDKNGFVKTIVHLDFSINNIMKVDGKYYLLDFRYGYHVDPGEDKKDNVWRDLVWLVFRSVHYTKNKKLFILLLEAYENQNIFSEIVKDLCKISGCKSREDFLKNIEYCLEGFIRRGHKAGALDYMLSETKKEYEKI